MKKPSMKITAVFLSVVLLISCAGVSFALSADNKKTEEPKTSAEADKANNDEAISKDETVYVLAGSDGTVKKIIVSDWVKNALSSNKLSDRTELKNIENVKGDEKYTLGSDNMTVWDAQGNDIYYKGDIEKELPVGLTVSYKLDGKSVTAEEIAGKSGKATIRFDYENRQYETVTIDGKQEKIYVPFAMLTGMLLDSSTFRNVEVSNGKMINDGDHTAVIGIALPGLQSNLGINSDKFDIPDYVEITADVTDFKLGMTVTIATNELFNQLDTSKLNNVDGITNSVNELTSGMTQLLDGSSALYNGLATLLDKSNELVGGINQMAEGVKTLKEASVRLDDGTGTLKDGITDLSGGLSQLAGKNGELTGGAKQVFETLLSTANTQLSAKGLNVETLTIDNYAEVLNGVIDSLDDTAVYNRALAEVTAGVEANRSVIEQRVTAVVRESVAEQVIPIATNGQMTKETYDAAVAAGSLPSSKVAAIEAAIDAQMNTEQIRVKISNQVDAQIQALISDKMASAEVQEKLAAASEGARAVIALKTSLDSYNTFYLGVIDYTNGVSSASVGANKLLDGAAELKNGTAQLRVGTATLYDGILQLKNGSPALVDGVSKLKDGAMQLSGGLQKLNNEGIGKISDLVNGNVKGLVTRIKATADVSNNYRNFSGISDGMDGQVKFIYRTDEINAK